MYSTSCGRQITAEAAYCPSCGGAQPGVLARRRFFRPRQGRKIAGVCLGVANYLDLDVTLVRVIWLLVALAGGGGFLAYLVAWFIMASEENCPYPAGFAQQTRNATG